VILNAVAGTSSSNTITFQSESGDSSLVILTDSAGAVTGSNFTLQLNGVDYCTFQNMTIRRTGTATYRSVISITNGSQVNSILNNQIQGIGATTLTVNSALIHSGAGTTSNDSANTFSNNLFENGSYGFYMYGPSATNLESGTVISGNIFKNTYGRSIQLGNQNAPVISGNEITTNSSYATFYCMYFTSCDNNMLIENNKMSSPSGYGLYFTSSTGASSSPIKVINNFIHVGGTGTSHAIYLTTSSFVNFYFNSVNVTGTGSVSDCFYATTATTSKLISQNNVFVNSGGGLTYNILASAAQCLSISNYNDLYTTGANLARYDTILSVPDLASWQSITGRDVNSVSADPVFVSSTDLHAFGGGISDVGIPLSAVLLDIDGEVRSTINPDLGADEFLPFNDNILVTAFVSPATVASCGDTAVVVEIAIGNIGSLPQSDIPVQVEITGPVTITLFDTIAGPLLPNTVTQNIFTQTINTTGGGQYIFKAFTSLANDQYRANDTIVATRNFYPIPNLPVAISPQQVCDNNAAIIASADSGHVVFWYDQPSGGNLLFSGDTFNTVLNSDTIFYAESREGSGSSGCLRITECEIGTNDHIEIQNLSGAGFDATGWVVAVSNSYTSINAVNANIWQLGYFNPSEIQTRSDVTGAQYWGSNILWNPGSNSWAMLVDPSGNVKDFVAWGGWTDTEIQSLGTAVNGFTVSIGAEWTGDGFADCSGSTVSRTGSSDSNNASDFACEANTIGLQNINLSPAFANCGMGICSSFRIPISVTVLPGVSVNLGNDTMLATPFSFTLDAGAGFTSYLWSDGSTNQTLTITSHDTYWVTITGANGCTFTDSINVDLNVGIQATIHSDLFDVYPNPANQALQIDFAENIQAKNIYLTDVNGRMVFERKIEQSTAVKSMTIDVGSFAPGLYFLQMVGEENVNSVKVIIHHD
jgi:hypothetical protein